MLTVGQITSEISQHRMVYGEELILTLSDILILPARKVVVYVGFTSKNSNSKFRL